MPLRLITGPANAEKAREVLDAYAQAIDRDPILVVPTFADVGVYRRELSMRGVVFGADVRRWTWLQREIATRAGVRGRPIGRLTQERVAARAVEQTDLRVLGASARTPGFARAFARLCEEIEEQRIDPGRWYVALRAWAAAEPGRTDYVEDLGDLYGAYRRGLERLGRLDGPLHATAALDALRLDPARWGGTPVLLYGFDDLTAPQLDAIETLAIHCNAEVVLSLPHEAGRTAFAGRATLYQRLLELGAEIVELEAIEDHYAPDARAVLHHIERRLFEPVDETVAPLQPGDELLLLSGGGERAEFELVAAHVAGLIADGMAPEEIAIVVRSPADQAALIADVLDSFAIPFGLRRRVPARNTAIGRALAGLISAALLDGDADDLLAWLRAPGHVRETWKVDELERQARRQGARSAAQARELWEGGSSNWSLEIIDRIARAQRDGPAALCDRLITEAERLMKAPHRPEAPLFSGTEELELAAARQLVVTLRELSSLATSDAGLVPDPRGLVQLLSDLEVFSGELGAGRVTVASPLDLRARRVRALFACSLQERSFPRPGRPEPFLGDAERRAINSAGGLRLEGREDRLGAERYLFYATVSRPTDILALSWHDADDDGAPLERSLFVDDVLDLFGPSVTERIERRELGAADATAELEDDTIGALTDPEILRSLAARETWSASSLETWHACPVRWFVERQLRPQALIPDPEPMVRGELAHKVLEVAIGALSGSEPGPLRPEHLPEARRLALDAIERHQADYRISTDPQRLLAAVERLRADILNYLEYVANAESEFGPRELELRFGGHNDELGPVELAPGLMLQGRVDRVDRSPGGGQAIVYDYKGAKGHAGASWERDGRLQLALYMLALPALLDVEVVGGLYQPLRDNKDPRPRGLLLDGADPDLRSVSTDRVDADALAQSLETAREAAVTALAEILAGRLEPRPATCGWAGGGCSYPSICRCTD